LRTLGVAESLVLTLAAPFLFQQHKTLEVKSMLKKSLTFALVATAILLAPSAAFAGGQEQYNEQRTYQSGAAVDGSTNIQNSENRNDQEQVQRNRRDYGPRNRDNVRYRDRDYYNRYRNRDRDRDYDRYYNGDYYDRYYQR
jgi:hypothetical protein